MDGYVNYGLLNGSTLNTSTLLCSYVHDDITTRSLKAGGYLLVVILSLIGNAFVVWVVKTAYRMRTVTNYFITNVACADLLTTIFNMLPTLFWIIARKDLWSVGGPLGEVLCKMLQFFQSVSIACSAFSMAAIAFDRFFAIFRPLKRTISFRLARWIIALIWISSCVISFPLVYVLTLQADGSQVNCIEQWAPLFDEEASPKDYTIALFVLFYALPLAIIAIIYTTVMIRLWRRKTPGQNLSTNQSNKERTNRKVLKMLITVVLVFALCWLPLYVRMFLIFLHPTAFYCGLPYHLDFMTLFLGHANSSINPYIYVVFNENFRKGFKAIFRRRKPPPRLTSSRRRIRRAQVTQQCLLLRMVARDSNDRYLCNDARSSFRTELYPDEHDIMKIDPDEAN